MTQTILGANGAIGIELAKELLKYTTAIKLVSRNPRKVNPTDILLSLDLTKRENIFRAVEGSSVVYITIGFLYKTRVWKQNWLPFIRSVIDACLKYNAKLVFLDTVYAIGGDHVNHITEASPISPISKKGEIRADVDRLIINSSKDKGLQAIIARAPDFFGGKARANSIIMNLVYDRFVNGKRAQWLCSTDKIHSYGYVPELAKGMAMLGNTEDAYGQIWNLPTDSQKIKGKEWIALFAKELNCKPKYRIMPNWLLKVVGLFVPVMSELVEMNYQYDRDYYFDSSKFNEYFKYKPVSNRVAIKQTVAYLSTL